MLNLDIKYEASHCETCRVNFCSANFLRFVICNCFRLLAEHFLLALYVDALGVFPADFAALKVIGVMGFCGLNFIYTCSLVAERLNVREYFFLTWIFLV